MLAWTWLWLGITSRIAAHAVGQHAPACRGRYCHPRSRDLNAR